MMLIGQTGQKVSCAEMVLILLEWGLLPCIASRRRRVCRNYVSARQGHNSIPLP